MPAHAQRPEPRENASTGKDELASSRNASQKRVAGPTNPHTLPEPAMPEPSNDVGDYDSNDGERRNDADQPPQNGVPPETMGSRWGPPVTDSRAWWFGAVDAAGAIVTITILDADGTEDPDLARLEQIPAANSLFGNANVIILRFNFPPAVSFVDALRRRGWLPGAPTRRVRV